MPEFTLTKHEINMRALIEALAAIDAIATRLQGMEYHPGLTKMGYDLENAKQDVMDSINAQEID